SYIDQDDISIAITGFSCRLPGDGKIHRSAWSKIPASRWKGDSFGSARKKRNTAFTNSWHFIKQDVSRFVGSFFGIFSAERAAMNPQRRLMTEVVYEAIRSAGSTLQKLQKSKTGVWMGHFTSGYKEMLRRDTDGAP
ncbi:beta-ketoacyl synthase, partial [Colletotrichum cereale]